MTTLSYKNLRFARMGFIVGCFLLVSSAPLFAAEDAAVSQTVSSGPTYGWGGAYTVNGTALSAMRVDADGRLYEQGSLMGHRLRWTPSITVDPTFGLFTEFQLSSGYLRVADPNARFIPYGPPRDSGAGVGRDFGEQVAVRKFYLRWIGEYGALLAGRMASDWGLGILANGGDRENEDWGAPRFGDDRNYGDIVNRLLYAARPFQNSFEGAWAKRLTTVVGADVVERDDRIRLSDGDFALQGIGALRYDYNKETNAGIYVAYRNLRDHLGDTMQVVALDLSGEGSRRFDDIEVFGAFEAAYVTGETTIARNNTVPFGPLAVKQFGYVARAGARYLPLGIAADVELAYASGDSNPNDTQVRNFNFDPDYNPSLILFEELRAAETVASTAQASDPVRVAEPQDALRYLPSGGSVSNTFYLRPTVRYTPIDDLKIRAALLWARSAVATVDPYNSIVAGGGAVNYQGGNGEERNLGIEINFGVDYGYRVDDDLEILAGVQAGRFWPGAGFADADGQRPDPINAFFGRLVLRWQPPKKS